MSGGTVVSAGANLAVPARRDLRPGPLRVSVRPVSELTGRDIAAWRELAGRAAEPNPFFEPEFLLPAARWVAEHPVGLLVAEDREGWAGCVPVRPPRWGRVRLPLLMAWRHAYCFLGTPLVERGRAREALGAIAARAAREDHAAGILLSWVGTGSAVSEALREVTDGRRLQVAVVQDFERATIARRDEPTYLETALGSKRRKELRRLERRLGEELGGAPSVVDRGGERDALEGFKRLEAAGWKGRHGTALVSDANHARFFTEMCQNFADLGRLQMLSLEGEARVAAMQCNLVGGEGLFCFKVAYDENLARLSPGYQLEVGAVDAFHKRTEIRYVDSCTNPDNELINRLWPDRRRISSLVATGGGAVGRSALAAARLAVRIRRHRRPERSAEAPAAV